MHLKFAEIRRLPTVSGQNRAPGVAAVAIAVTVSSGLVATPCSADPSRTLNDAVQQVRGSSNCPALQYDPLAEHTATIVNRSTDTYLGHTAHHVPVEDALPIYRDLGGNAGKARILLGAGNTDADATKGLLLQGYAAIPDCSYTGFGTDMLWNAESGRALLAVVLVSP